MTERFQPISVKPPSASPIAFWVRCLADLQLKTIAEFLRPTLAPLRGKLLDVGAGESPWRDFLSADVEYTGVDVDSSEAFGMRPSKDVVYYDGVRLPFQDSEFDHSLCVEVLEHVRDPAAFLGEIRRVLRANGLLVLTVPWSARRHHLPSDFHRFTREGLAQLFESAGFVDVRIAERGNSVAVIANKLLVLSVDLLRPRRSLSYLWRMPLGLANSALVGVFLCAAHVSMAAGEASSEDPLGYAVTARKP